MGLSSHYPLVDSGACVENKREDYHHCFCAHCLTQLSTVLCARQWHNNVEDIFHVRSAAGLGKSQANKRFRRPGIPAHGVYW